MTSTEAVDAIAIARDSTVSDEEIVAQVLAGELEMFEVLMRRYNQRLFRISRSIVKTDEDAEDVMQEAYLLAFRHLSSFQGRSKFSTWLTKIALHEALAKRRRLQRFPVAGPFRADDDEYMERIASRGRDPEGVVSNDELGQILENAVDSLPDSYRSVFVLRNIEGLDTADTADNLGIGREAVKTRLHRARLLLKQRLKVRLGEPSAGFTFLGSRCNRMVRAVLSRLRSDHVTLGRDRSALAPCSGRGGVSQ